MKKRDDLDRTLMSVDDESDWHRQDKHRLKERIFQDIEKMNGNVIRKQTHSLKYYIAVVSVSLLLFILLFPNLLSLFDSDIDRFPSSASRMKNVTEEGYNIEIQRKIEERDGYRVFLQIENESIHTFEENEMFIKHFAGELEIDSVGEDWVFSPNPEELYVDRQSILIEVEEVRGSFAEIDAGSSVIIDFFVPSKIIEDPHVEIVYQSVKIPPVNARTSDGFQHTFHVIDVNNEKVGMYDESQHTPVSLKYVLVVLFFIVSLYIIWRHKTKRMVLLIATIVIVALMYIGMNIIKDDITEIENVVNEISWPMMEVVHIEMLDHGEALAFYEHGGGTLTSFGSVLVKETFFGWKNVRGGSSSHISARHPMGWNYSNYDYANTSYQSLLNGKLLNEEIDEIVITIHNIDKEVSGNIIDYGDGERFWYYISEDDNLDEVTIYGISKNGEIVEQYSNR
ncbi:hypothetical protein [Evansella cellulosilytica]|uniref:Uncharacterized protein n=1 Tax=Evansella cellulosilytica (strain ATCC 21833 / DSM 2522 / FERM P-1141 / JCM 9156 / N-4) TaxID=649639 RepID=E6TRB6_EVAC2|nr:hypothetical protein [Evansella cellulosilytica]ADU30628.1 hypothetical protein Bcell_2370 [Evansella cellulosilytica DSM 2522]